MSLNPNCSLLALSLFTKLLCSQHKEYTVLRLPSQTGYTIQMNPTNPCKDLGLSLLYLSMHPFSRVMPIGTRALGSFPLKPFQTQPPDQSASTVCTSSQQSCCWYWAMGLHPPMWLSPTLPLLPHLGQSAPVQPQSHVPLACGPVHCPCELPVCALPGCTAHVHCLGAACARSLSAGCARGLWALAVRAAWAWPVHAAWALGLGAACAHCMGVVPGCCLCTLHGCCACVRCLCTQPRHCLCALPVHAAWALSTRSWHCAHDHQPMCAGIECPMPQIRFSSFHCPQCLKALLLAIQTHIRISHPIPHVKPAMPYFSLRSSHGCKAPP